MTASLLQARPRTITGAPFPDEDALTIVGDLPSALSGLLLRPSRGTAAEAGDPSCRWRAHARTGPPHGIRFDSGQAWRYRTAPGRHEHRALLPEGGRLSHVWPDPDRGRIHRLRSHPGARGVIHAEHWVGDEDNRWLASTLIDLPEAPLIQAIAVTCRHLVLFDLPAAHHQAAALIGDPWPFRWDRHRAARIGVLPLGRPGPVRWTPIAACFVAHLANAYETDGTLVIEGVRRPEFSGSASPGPEPGQLWRWSVDLERRQCHEQSLSGPGYDLPVIDERFRGRPHRVTFTLGTAAAATTLVRHDVDPATTVVRAFDPGRSPDGMVFVPASRSAAEGEGWVLMLLDDIERNRTEVAVLAADDLLADPLATVLLPVGLPPGGHPRWVAP